LSATVPVSAPGWRIEPPVSLPSDTHTSPALTHAALPPEQMVKAARLVREGRTYSLAAARYPGMPLFPGHPPFQVLNYRTPRGIRVTGAKPWGPINDAGLGYMAEYVMATSHSGAHIDALAHMTVGDDSHWYGGGRADDHLTDHFGLVTDYLSECWTKLREGTRISALQGRAHWGGALSGRDIEAVNKTISGLLKLLFPDPEMPIPDAELEGVMRTALEARRRVKGDSAGFSCRKAEAESISVYKAP